MARRKKKADMDDRERWIESQRKQYPFVFETPYEGFPTYRGHFIWAPDKKNGVALYMFPTEEALEAFVAYCEGDVQAA